jgi:hypothetical protein
LRGIQGEEVLIWRAIGRIRGLGGQKAVPGLEQGKGGGLANGIPVFSVGSQYLYNEAGYLHAANQGHGAAVLVALALADGELIAFQIDILDAKLEILR